VRRATSFFCHSENGSPVASGDFGGVVKAAPGRAGVERPMREFHDWRHTEITNAAAAGMEPMAIMRMAGWARAFGRLDRLGPLAWVRLRTGAAFRGRFRPARCAEVR
jgi:hypothetical protein